MQLDEMKNKLKEEEEKTLDDEITRKMEQLRERQKRKRDKKAQKKKEVAPQKSVEEKPIAVGDNVRIKGQNGIGKVVELNDKNAVVIFGMLKTTVKTDKLERSDKAAQPTQAMAKSTFVSTQTQDQVYQKKLNFKQDIDVRGMRGDEAIQAVTYFIDDAILLGVSRVRILHGTGSGILRTLIRDYLSTVSGVAHF